MRKSILALTACALFATGSVYAVEAEKMDESTNPDTNKDVKTQNLQQKPNADEAAQDSANSNSKMEDKNVNVKDQTDDAASTTETEKLRQKAE